MSPPDSPSRRGILTALGTLATTAIAGCSALAPDTDGTVRCGSESIPSMFEDAPDAVEGIRDVRPARADDGVYLLVTVWRDAVDRTGRLVVRDADGELAAHVPVMDNQDINNLDGERIPPNVVPYAIRLGEAPVHGLYRVWAFDPDGTALDGDVTRFNCFVDETL